MMKSLFPLFTVWFLFLLCVYMQGNEESNWEIREDFFKSKAFLHSLALTQSLNLARQEHIHESCRRFPPNLTLDELPSHALEHIYYNKKYKLLFCYIPKVACTNWKRILMILGDQWNNTDLSSIPSAIAHKNTIPTLAQVPKQDRKVMFEKYHKFIFVRNPFERLLSAYRNKLQNPIENYYFLDRYGRKIVSMFRKNPSNESLKRGHDVTFEEFARFVTSQVDENEHWRPMASLCYPCLVNYTLIGKYETLMEDATLALHSIGASHIQFPRVDRTSNTAEMLTQYYSKLPLTLVKQLYKYYRFRHNPNYSPQFQGRTKSGSAQRHSLLIPRLPPPNMHREQTGDSVH